MERNDLASRPVEAIVPAFNEEATVGQVVRALILGGMSVVVVDDGSTDRTAAVARRAGGRVHRIDSNGGKAEAMMAGMRMTASDPVAFFDADLVGIRPDHVARMLNASSKGYDMVCALRDYGMMGNPMQTVMPLITGERIVRRWVLQTVPQDCWRGYAIETAMNHALTRGRGKAAMLFLDGVTIRTKVNKFGFLKGLAGHAKMFSKIYSVNRCLDEGGSCEIPKR